MEKTGDSLIFAPSVYSQIDIKHIWLWQYVFFSIAFISNYRIAIRLTF